MKQAHLYGEVIQQGCDEGVFKTSAPLECAEFTLLQNNRAGISPSHLPKMLQNELIIRCNFFWLRWPKNGRYMAFAWQSESFCIIHLRKV